MFNLTIATIIVNFSDLTPPVGRQTILNNSSTVSLVMAIPITWEMVLINLKRLIILTWNNKYEWERQKSTDTFKICDTKHEDHIFVIAKFLRKSTRLTHYSFSKYSIILKIYRTVWSSPITNIKFLQVARTKRNCLL